MTADFPACTRLRLVVSIDDGEWAGAGSAEDALFIIDDESWLWEPVGCVVCVEAEEDSMSFRAALDPTRFRCQRCGPLFEVPYVLRKAYRMQLGTLERTGEETIEDSMLFPVSIEPDDLHQRLETMLAEADDDHDQE